MSNSNSKSGNRSSQNLKIFQNNWRKKKMAKRKRFFAWSPLRTLMKRAGARIVSRDAVDTLLWYLEERSKKLTAAALNFAKHSKRKKITAGDIQLATEYI
jgi:histone H3/H4